LAPFVDRQMRDQFPDEDWIVTAATKLGKREPVLASPTDPQFQLEVMVRWWGPVFARVLSKDTRDTVQDLRKARNDWAHIDDSHPMDLDYARRVHTLAEDLLQEIGSPQADAVSRHAEELERVAARTEARERGVSEEDVLIAQLTQLQSDREALAGQLEEARNEAQTAAGRQRAVARQLAELQAQYAAVAGLRERYLDLQESLDKARRAGDARAEDVTVVRAQLETAEMAVGGLQADLGRLHHELESTRKQMARLDPVETEIGKRWVMLVAALIMVLGIVIILAVAKGTTI
jgi:chromosome segregation ATPase